VNLSLEQPVWLWLLILIPVIALIGLRWFISMSLARRWSAVIIRAALIALITAMLAGASSVRLTDRLAVVAVIDVSGSVRRFTETTIDEETGDVISPIQRAKQFLQRAAAGRGPEDLLGLVVFDGKSAAIAAPSRGDVLERSIDLELREGTDLAGALRFARALIPPGARGRLMLISDGVETSGRALLDAPSLNLPIDVVPITYTVTDEVLVEFVDAPPTAPGGSSVNVRVGIKATDPVTGELRLFREGEQIDIDPAEPGLARRLALPAGQHVELVRVELPEGRVHRFEAVFEPDRAPDPAGGTRAIADTNIENNKGQAFTLTPGQGGVLLLDGVSQGAPSGAGATLAEALRAADIPVEIRSPRAAPESPLDLQPFDLVILQNVPVEDITERPQQALIAHVHDAGGGLVMVGGPDSFGAGGWIGSDLADILPVALDLPDTVVTPEAAIMLVLDRSGSMNDRVLGSSRTKQQVANEAAALAVRSLDKKDLVGVIAFSSGREVVIPLGPNYDPDRSASKIRSIWADGGTIIGPALQDAGNALRNVDAKIKHIIVLSDGRSEDADSLEGIAAQLARLGIAVSTISVGSQADDETMRKIANAGAGRFHKVLNAALLRGVFLKAVRVVRNPMVRLGPFRPVVLPTGSPVTLDLPSPPMLQGIALTRSREEPTITYAMVDGEGAPLLAHWNVGLGRVGAFTSDAHDWASPWLDDPIYAEFWTRLVRTLSRSTESSGFELTTEVAADELRIRMTATARDGAPLDLLSVPATIYAPEGETIETRLSQTAPGTYETAIPARSSGNYVLLARPELAGQALAPVIGGASVSSGVEYRRLRSNEALLERLAQETGGRIFSLSDPPADPDIIFDRTGLEPVRASSPIWRTLLLWTIAVLLLDVGTRRVAWDRFVGREFGEGVSAAARRALRDRGAGAEASIGSLKRSGAKEARTAPLTGQAAVTDEEMARMQREQAEQRRAAHIERVRAMRAQAREQEQAEAQRDRGTTSQSSPAKQAKPEQAKSEQAKPQPDKRDKPAPVERIEDDAESGLLAAKRRARKRFEDDA